MSLGGNWEASQFFQKIFFNLLQSTHGAVHQAAQWSSSLEIRRLFNGYVTTYGKTIECEWHVCLRICVLFLIWPRDPLYCQISLILSIFWTFEADLRGLIMF